MFHSVMGYRQEHLNEILAEYNWPQEIKNVMQTDFVEVEQAFDEWTGATGQRCYAFPNYRHVVYLMLRERGLEETYSVQTLNSSDKIACIEKLWAILKAHRS